MSRKKKTRKKGAAYVPPRKGKNRALPIAIGLAALVLVGGVAYSYVDDWRAAQSTVAYAPEDVVQRQPFTAIHQMGPGPRIQFLPPNQPQPTIVVREGVHNFGTVGPREVVSETFAIRNDGKAPLTISRAFTTCGCTVAQITARVIPPGKVALATLRFDAGFHDARGQTVKRGLVIESNDRRRWKAEIWTKASVRMN
jgi:hypothetical protein